MISPIWLQRQSEWSISTEGVGRSIQDLVTLCAHPCVPKPQGRWSTGRLDVFFVQILLLPRVMDKSEVLVQYTSNINRMLVSEDEYLGQVTSLHAVDTSLVSTEACQFLLASNDICVVLRECS